MESNIKVLETNVKMLCPFRTKTIMTQNMTGGAEQLIEYPECHYIQCPMYNPEGTTVQEKCMQAIALIDRVSYGQ